MLAAVLGGAAVAIEPGVLVWAPLYTALLAVSLVLAWNRADRSLTSGLVTVLATSVMTLVAQAPRSPDLVAWWLAGVMAAFFTGSLLYVRTMIRERGNRAVHAASVAVHLVSVAAVAVSAVAVSEPTGVTVSATVVLALLAARAVVVPRAWPAARPLAVGLGELAASIALGAVLLAA